VSEERYNCGLVGCMRCGNVPTPEQQAEIDAHHVAKMRANAEAAARYFDRMIFAEVYEKVFRETVKPS
jgi:hypothetical protein